MSDSPLECEITPRAIATLTLNRPDRSNAFDQTMMTSLQSQLIELGRAEAVRVIVLRGAGRHFSAGADVASPREDAGPNRRTTFADLFLTLDAVPKPTIAVVQGACVGGAAGLAACCDVVLAAESAFFSIPEVRLGVAPIGVTPVLVRAMGLRNFRRYALSGERIGAEKAVEIGLAHEALPQDELRERLDTLIDAFLLSAPGAMRELKAHLASSCGDATRQMQEAASQHGKRDGFKSPEALEGVAAFKERRKPSWYRA